MLSRYVTSISTGCITDRFIQRLDIDTPILYYVRMDYLLLDKVVAHLERHASTNTYYKGLLRQYELLGRLSPKQLASVHTAIVEDNRRAQDKARADIREWDATH